MIRVSLHRGGFLFRNRNVECFLYNFGLCGILPCLVFPLGKVRGEPPVPMALAERRLQERGEEMRAHMQELRRLRLIVKQLQHVGL